MRTALCEDEGISNFEGKNRKSRIRPANLDFANEGINDLAIQFDNPIG